MRIHLNFYFVKISFFFRGYPISRKRWIFVNLYGWYYWENWQVTRYDIIVFTHNATLNVWDAFRLFIYFLPYPQNNIMLFISQFIIEKLYKIEYIKFAVRSKSVLDDFARLCEKFETSENTFNVFAFFPMQRV